jgi:hypothetical protein
MAGHKRFRAGAWRLTVETPPDPIAGERHPVLAMYQEGPVGVVVYPPPSVSTTRLANLEPLTDGQLRACRLIASLTHIKRAGTFRSRQMSMTGRALT